MNIFLLKTLQWYLPLLFLGILFFPISYKLFGKFIDHGYALSKTIAIIFLSYFMFLAGVFSIVSFSRVVIASVLILTVLLVVKFFKNEALEIIKLSRKDFIIILIVEALFIFGLFFLAFVRAQEPSIHGLEKFMDFGFIQSINRTEYMPPLDMWYGPDDVNPNGYPINYYYFGHLTGAFLIKISGLNPFDGYNLILATILAQGLSISFSLVGTVAQKMRSLVVKKKNLSKIPIILIGLIGSFLVNFAGNLHTIYLFTTGYPNEKPIPFWKIFSNIFEVKSLGENSSFLDALIRESGYWYPNATRFIPYTIHEFPSYSYVVADLHGHVFDIPFVLLTISLIFVLIETAIERKNTKKTGAKSYLSKIVDKISHKNGNVKNIKKWVSLSQKELILTVLIGATIAVNYMTNAFDGPIYLLLVVFVSFVIYKLSLDFFIQIFTTIISFVIFSLPFSTFFAPFASKIGVNCSANFLVEMKEFGPFIFEEGNCQASAPYMLFVLWGFFWISAILLIIALIKKSWFDKKNKNSKRNVNYVDYALLGLFLFGTFLIIVPEFLYAKDIYPGHFRANTMFKLGYQAFIMMSIASALAFYRISLLKSIKGRILQFIWIFFFMFVFIYPFTAFPSYYGNLKNLNIAFANPQLDGSIWLNNKYPENKEIIDFLNENVAGQPVILEAQGDSYTDYNEISSYTGLPTVAGWWVHEWLWRGSSDVVGSRIPDIEALYQSNSLEDTKKLLDKYQIQYVVISTHEKEKYKDINEEKFKTIGTKVFESKNGLGALYKVY